MDISNRLKCIVKHIDKCESIIDVGSDHGYIPIYTVKNNIVKNAIASDINKGPTDKARLNAQIEGVIDKVDIRRGAGLAPTEIGETDGLIIAGMGGNLIIDILEADMAKVKKFKFIILQPAQNPEVLRKYLYNSGYEVLEEDLCYDEGIYYELFKVKWNNCESLNLEDLFYEISPIMLKNKHKLMKDFLIEKVKRYKKIVSNIKDEGISAQRRKRDLEKRIEDIEKFIKGL